MCSVQSNNNADESIYLPSYSNPLLTVSIKPIEMLILNMPRFKKALGCSDLPNPWSEIVNPAIETVSRPIRYILSEELRANAQTEFTNYSGSLSRTVP